MSRTWMITGVSSGFGYEMTKQLLERGDTVIGTVRNMDKVKDLMEKYPLTFDCRILDVTDTAGVQELVHSSFKQHERIDVVVSNAGYGLFGCVEELSDEEINHIIATNLVGSIQLLKTSVPYLRKQGGGRIIQMSTYVLICTLPSPHSCRMLSPLYCLFRILTEPSARPHHSFLLFPISAEKKKCRILPTLFQFPLFRKNDAVRIFFHIFHGFFQEAFGAYVFPQAGQFRLQFPDTLAL